MPTPIFAAQPRRLYRRPMPLFVLAFLLFVTITGLHNSCLANADEPASTPSPGASPHSDSATTPPPTLNFAPATREELAVAYRRIDTLLQKQLGDGAPPAHLADLNKSFDAATLRFFSGQFATVLKDLAEVAGTLNPGTSASDADAWLALRSLAVRFELSGDDPKIIFHSLFPLPRPVHTTLYIDISAARLGNLQHVPLDIPASSSFQISISLASLLSKQTDVPLTVAYSVPAAAEHDHWESRPFVLHGPRHDEMITGLRAKLAQCPDTPPFAITKALLAARLDLIATPRNSNQSVHFMGYTSRIFAEMSHDLKVCSGGINPFVNRDSIVYRPIIAEGAAIPMYVYAPPSSFNRGPVPLVIALHGAGGDEAMFINAYGNGEAKRQAELHGCILATPSTTALMTSPAVLDALIQQVAADYPIDQSRIFIVGHSMGAGAASGLARSRASALAGVVCLAGGRVSTKPLSTGETIAPMLAIYATLDPLTGNVDINRINDAAHRHALPVEAREMKDWGHTLMVGPALPQAFDWMMKQPPLRTAPAK